MNASKATDADVRVEVYRLFTDRGRAPVPAELAASLGLAQSDVEDALHRLADEHVLVLAPGTPYIWMANPLSALPTPYSVETSGGFWFANCIWDALGVVAMLGGDGTVRTWCPCCAERLTTAVADGRLVPGEGVVHFAVPAAQWWEDIGFT